VSKPKRGLGRGLGALIPTEAEETAAPSQRPSDVFFAGTGAIPQVSDDSRPVASDVDEEDAPDLLPVPGARFSHIDPHAVVPNPRQPRTVFDEEALAELVGSIKEIGVLQPIVVRPNPAGEGYELIMGERRLRASKEAGLAQIPAIVRSTDDVDMLRDALVENLHRSQLNPLEEAQALHRLLEEFELTHQQIAQAVGKSRTTVTNLMRLLELNPDVKEFVEQGQLEMGHARALLALEGDLQSEAAARVVRKGLSVRETEALVRRYKEQGGAVEKKKAPPPELDPDVRRLLRDVAENREVGDVTTLADSSVMAAIKEGLAQGKSD